MKKTIILIAVMLMLLSTSVFATGVGISAGLPIGEGLPATNLMLSAKLDTVPFLLGLGFGFDPFYLGLTADWWALNENLAGMLNIYIGPGLYMGINSGSDTQIDFGARLPIGLNIFPLDFMELFIEIAPTLVVLPEFPTIGVQAAAGLRFWF